MMVNMVGSSPFSFFMFGGYRERKIYDKIKSRIEIDHVFFSCIVRVSPYDSLINNRVLLTNQLLYSK